MPLPGGRSCGQHAPRRRRRTHPAAARRRPAQALLFIDGRAAGRLTQPVVTVDSEGDAAQVSLRFETLAPARGSGEQPLQLPADELAPRSLRVQVFGRQGGSTFAVPQSFQTEGRELVAALDVQRQWQEYQRRHQAARQSAGQPTSAANFAHSSTLAVQSGAEGSVSGGSAVHGCPGPGTRVLPFGAATARCALIDDVGRIGRAASRCGATAPNQLTGIHPACKPLLPVSR